MEKETAYNLYHKSNEFQEILKNNGFYIEKAGERFRVKMKVNPTSQRPNTTLHIGEIIGQYFILHNYNSNKTDKRFLEPMSKLQKLAEEFKINY